MRKQKLIFLAAILVSVAVGAQDRFGLSGIVADSLDNSRIVKCHIRLLLSMTVSAGARDSTVTDSNGEFAFRDLAQGAYIVEMSAPGYNVDRVSVIVPSGLLCVRLTRKTYKFLPILVTAQIAKERQSPTTFSELPNTIINHQFTYQDIPILLSQLPSITEYSENGEGVGYSYINMRGFDQQRISIMVNGVPQNDPEDHNVYWIDMPDLQSSAQSIQVQRGAGNEFYGAPAIGGSINLQTRNLATEQDLNFTFGMGSTGSNGYVRRYSASLSSGLLGERYAVFAHVAKNTTDGYRQDSWVDLDSYFLTATRYDDNMTTEINLYGGPISDALSYLGLPKFAALDKNLRTQNWDDWNNDSNWVSYSPHMARFVADGDTVYAVPRRSLEIENFSQPHFELLNEWKISPALTVNNTIFAILGSGFFDYDGSWADTSYLRISSQYGLHPVGNPSDALIHAYEDLQQYGWLPRLTVRHNDGALVLGAELDQNSSDHWASIRSANDLPPDLPGDYHYNEWRARTDVVTAFGHELYDIDPQLTLMLDLEYEFKQYDFYDEKFVGNTFIVPYHFLNPRVGLNYNITQESSLYLNLSQTSREPQLASLYNADESSYDAGQETSRATPNFALNPDGSYNFGVPLIKPETLNDFELGYHYSSQKLTVGVTAYWMEFSDELVSNGVLDQYGQPVDGNAARTRHIGLEFETSVILTNELSIYGNLSISRNKLIHYVYYESYDDSLGNTFAVPDTLDGNRIGGFPELLGNIRATYTSDDLSIVLLGQYVGSQYTDNFQSALNEIDPYFVVNGWISYRLNKFLSLSSVEFKLYCNNVLNRLYIAHGEGEYFYPAATRSFFINCSIDL
jgi:iron complex outermembrane receptor protein